MSNIGPVIGAVVGVFIILIVGLNLFETVANTVADLLGASIVHSFIATGTVLGILPTIVILGLFAAGGVIGAAFGRQAQNRLTGR